MLDFVQYMMHRSYDISITITHISTSIVSQGLIRKLGYQCLYVVILYLQNNTFIAQTLEHFMQKLCSDAL